MSATIRAREAILAAVMALQVSSEAHLFCCSEPDAQLPTAQRKPWGEMVDRSAFSRPANLAEVRTVLALTTEPGPYTFHTPVCCCYIPEVGNLL